MAEKMVHEPILVWAIKKFHPFKSAGPDGIYPALLQSGLDIILHLLAALLRACIAWRYIPEEWRNSKVVFIPKPGRIDYALAISYRPISLSSFLKTTLERLCDRYIRDVPLLHHLIHCNQYAHIPGRST